MILILTAIAPFTATVKRGQRIGAVGTSGQRAWPGFEHVHLEETQPYTAARLVLTYPVKCPRL
jgi:hypothetical protein